MNIPARLKVNASLFAAVVLIISLLFAVVLHMQRAAFERSLVAEGLLRGAYELNALSNRYLRYPGERPKEQWQLVYDQLAQDLGSRTLARSGNGVILNRMRRNLAHMKVLFQYLVEANEKRSAEDVAPAGSSVFERYRVQLADLIIKRSRNVSLDAERLTAIGNAEVVKIGQRISTFNPLVAALLTALTLWMSLQIGRSIAGPVGSLRAGVEKVGSGDLDYRIGITTKDEIGELSAAFDQMTERLKATTVSRNDLLKEIAERSRAEEALKQSERYLNAIIENAPACIKLVGADGTLLKMNAAGLSIIGADSAQQVQGKSIYPLVTPRDRKAFMDLTAGVFEGRPGTLEFEAVGIDGKHLWLSTHAVPLHDNAGNVTALLGITVDVSERRRADEERERLLADLARSNRELEQFAYVASHDLQEPLRMVASYADLLQTRYKGKLDDKADRYINFTVDGAVRMQKLIEGLLEYSRITRRGAEFVSVSANAVIDEAVSNLAAAIRESRAVVTKDDLPEVRGDEIQLTQLFQNLIGNAIKFRSPGTAPGVHISAKREGDTCVFAVRDNGIGIDREYADRIFLIFQRLHTREEYPGTGIGLALCKRIVERHHGRIWVESSPGQGSTFFFTIPECPSVREKRTRRKGAAYSSGLSCMLRFFFLRVLM